MKRTGSWSPRPEGWTRLVHSCPLSGPNLRTTPFRPPRPLTFRRCREARSAWRRWPARPPLRRARQATTGSGSHCWIGPGARRPSVKPKPWRRRPKPWPPRPRRPRTPRRPTASGTSSRRTPSSRRWCGRPRWPSSVASSPSASTRAPAEATSSRTLRG